MLRKYCPILLLKPHKIQIIYTEVYKSAPVKLYKESVKVKKWSDTLWMHRLIWDFTGLRFSCDTAWLIYLGSILQITKHLDDEDNTRKAKASAMSGQLCKSVLNQNGMTLSWKSTELCFINTTTGTCMGSLSDLPAAQLRLKYFHTSCLRKLLRIK